MLGDDIQPQRIRRDATMLDVFPTLLDALGFRLERSRAGLGTSLFSDQRTLVEAHGIEVLNERLREETALQHRLWEGISPQRRETDELSSQQQTVETPADLADEVELSH